MGVVKAWVFKHGEGWSRVDAEGPTFEEAVRLWEKKTGVSPRRIFFVANLQAQKEG